MLTETIEKSYRLFSKYKATRPLDVCTICCMTVEEEGKLAGLSVREIPKDLLATYNDSAKPEKTRIEELKHFLPRYLDLIGHFDFPSHSTELSFSRLVPFDKNEWTEQEFDLLTQFAHDFFEHCLSIYPIPSHTDGLDTILIMLWRAGFNIKDLLIIWENNNGKESLLHLRDLLFNGFQYNQSSSNNSFGDKELTGILRSWLDSKNVKQKFAEAIAEMIVEKNTLEEKETNEFILVYQMLTS